MGANLASVVGEHRRRRGWLGAAVGAAVVAGALGAIYWVATGGEPGAPAPAWLTAKPVAHRGLHSSPVLPENSLAAFRAAADAGYPVELDVRLSADGVPVVMHDASLARMTGQPTEVTSRTAAQIQALHLAGTTETVPTLTQALAEIAGRVPVLIELKDAPKSGALEKAVAGIIASEPGSYAVMAFDPFALERFAAYSPSTPRGQLSGTFRGESLPAWQTFLLQHLLLNWKSRPTFVAYDISATPSWDTRLQRARGRKVLAWTAEDPADVARMGDAADNVIANPGGLPAR